MPGSLGKPVKNYSGCSFSLRIPTLTIYADRAVIDSFVIPQKSVQAEGIVLDYCKLIGRNGILFEEKPSKDFFPASGKSAKISITISAPFKQVVYTGATVIIGFLTQSGKRVEVSFKCDLKQNLQLEFVRTGIMDEVDESRFLTVINEYMKSSRVEPNSDCDPAPPPQVISSIDEYISAVEQEKAYLKNHGGRKYKVTNGKRISSSGGTYSYIFDLETELYLADDAPIKLSTGSGVNSNGNILLCEGFKIAVVLSNDLGLRIGVAYISVEPWRLLDSLSECLKRISTDDHIAMRLLRVGPTLSGSKPLSSLATCQETAKEKAHSSPITIVWGPPGTGKTHTMAEIAIEVLTQNQTVLIVSHSNISVDGVVLKVAELLETKQLQQYLMDGKVLRYGYVRDEKLSHHPTATSFYYALNRSPTLKKKLEELNSKKEKLRGGEYSEAHIKIEEEIKKLRAFLRNEEKNYVNQAQLVATTASKIYSDSLFDSRKYDVVLFDEASMAYVPQILCAAAFAREHFICVGDFRQLAPIVQSNAKRILEKDIFAFLNTTDEHGNFFYHPWLVLLNEQRRMHPAISTFPNKEIYAGLLKNHPSTYSTRDEVVKKEPFPGEPITLFDMTGTYCAAGKNSDNSRYNILSAITAFTIAVTVEKSKEESVGIITPYAAQTRLIRAFIQDYQKDHDTHIACSTVHQFQGSERNVIIFDAVESYPSKQAGWLMSKNENNSLARLINVAITRAKGKLIVVANRGFWLKKFEGTKNTLYLLIQHILKNGNVVDVKNKQVNEFYQSLDVGGIMSIHSSVQSCIDILVSDIEGAKRKILISLPDNRLVSENAVPIEGAILSAIKNGVACEIKANNVTELPPIGKRE